LDSKRANNAVPAKKNSGNQEVERWREAEMKREIFTDFDAFRATNPQLDGEWLINGGKDWHWSSDSVAVGDCGILRCYSRTGLIIEGVGSKDFYGFYIPFKSGIWRNNGVGFDDNEIIVIEPGAEHCETSKVEDGWHGFFVPKHLVAIEPEITGERARFSYAVTCHPTRTDAVRDLFRRVIAAVAENPDIESSPAARIAGAELQSLLLPTLELERNGAKNNDGARGRPSLPRREIVKRAQAVMEAFNSEPIHVSELARLVGVSERSLRTVFNEYYQLGPRQYLHLRQLHKVRRDLLVSTPDKTTVTDVLARWGVWEFGRFSGRYKTHFGELPNETLRRPLISPSCLPSAEFGPNRGID
jgi:AraC family ethanolamine operon transcriptional activator